MLFEALDLGDGILHRLAGRLVDDAEDFFERPAVGLGLAPAGELLRHRIHHLDPAIGVAGDDPVADGVQRGA